MAMFHRLAWFAIASTATHAFVVPTPHTCTAVTSSTTTALASSLETSSQQRRSLDERMAALERGSRGAAAYSNIEAERMRHLDTSSTAELQGEGAIKTWSFDDPALETVDVRLFNEGLPLEAVLDLWQGPSHTPTQAIIYSEDGNQHPLTAKILLLQQRTNHGSHTVGIRNTAPMTFPCTADVGATSRADESILRLLHAPEEVVQGGALHTFTLDPYVDRVRVLIKNDVFGDGRPLHARIELLQGPNNKKQVLEVYTDDGPFYCEMETPGSGYVVRVVNISPMEFPLGAVVETYGEGAGRGNYRSGYNGNNNYRGGGSYYDNDNRYASSDRSRYDVRNGRGGSYYGSAGAMNSYGRGGGGGYGYGNSGYGNTGYGNRRYGGSTYGDSYYNNNNNSNRLGGYGNYGNSLYSGNNRNQGYGYGNNNSYGYGGGGGYGNNNNRYNNGGYGYNNNRYNNGGYGYNNRGGYGYNNNNNRYGRGGGGYGVGYNNNYGNGGYNNNGGNFANRFMRNNNDVLRDGNLNRRWYD